MNGFCYGQKMYAQFLDLPLAWPEECCVVYSGCYDGGDEDAITTACNYSFRIFF